MNGQEQEVCDRGGDQAGGDVVEHDAGAIGKAFKLSDRWWLKDVEEPEENQRESSVGPVCGKKDEGKELAGDLVDDYETRVFATGFTSDDGGGWDPDEGC